MYLVLEVNAPHIPTSFSRSSTLDTLENLLLFLYGTITLYRISFQKTSSLEEGLKKVHTPHLHYITITDSV